MIFKQMDQTSIRLPAIGQGMGAYSWDESQIDVLRAGIDLGANLIDTAEEYDNGRSEEIVGKAVRGIRDKVIIATKFSPQNNAHDNVLEAAEGSLKRLKTDYIDLYQVHWPNPAISLDSTLSAMERLVRDGKVRYIGMGNYRAHGLRQAQSLLDGSKIATCQVEYNLFDRTIEDEILPLCEAERILVVAYSPLDKGRIVDGAHQRKIVEEMANKYGRTPAQIALRWLISKRPVVVIPKARSMRHLRDNALATEFDLDKRDIEQIDKAFRTPLLRIPPDKIRVSLQGEYNRLTYQTLEEARSNPLGFVPSPEALSKHIIIEKTIKPVRLIRTPEPEGRYDYDLVEGRIRYWAWVMAKKNEPIPSLVREEGL
ncbi:MAG: aldo/keto reductase [Sedimentisphaerales bacterium]|nr:aldo/keto reductase [Sedimentisphaerales bacterium]